MYITIVYKEFLLHKVNKGPRELTILTQSNIYSIGEITLIIITLISPGIEPRFLFGVSVTKFQKLKRKQTNLRPQTSVCSTLSKTSGAIILNQIRV